MHRGRRRHLGGRRLAAAAGLALCLIATPTSAGLSEPRKILGGPEDQFAPAANGSYLIWTQNSESNPDRFHAYGRSLTTGRRVRLNAAGTRGFTGGLDPSGNTAIYQQIDGTSSDLFLYDLDDRTRRRLRAPVSTARWEWDPRISDTFVLFLRYARGETSLWLHERGATSATKLRSWDFTSRFVATGTVGDRYATWTVCGPLTCNAWLHDTVAGTSRRISTENGRAQYAPAVDEAGGMLYVVRSGPSCGASVGIWRRPVDLSSPAERLIRLPDGIDTGWTLSLERDDARLDLWFSRYRCAPEQGDVFELRDVAVP